MGLTEPVSGSLVAHGALTPGATVTAKAGVKLETEVGYVLANAISSPVDEANVLASVAHFVPVVEIARPYFDGRPTGADMIATNSASYEFISGDPMPPAVLSGELEASLTRDNSVLHSASVDSVPGGQLGALCWLINHLLERNAPLEAGFLLITGAIGGMQEPDTGSYEARFGALGSIPFDVKP